MSSRARIRMQWHDWGSSYWNMEKGDKKKRTTCMKLILLTSNISRALAHSSCSPLIHVIATLPDTSFLISFWICLHHCLVHFSDGFLFLYRMGRLFLRLFTRGPEVWSHRCFYLDAFDFFQKFLSSLHTPNDLVRTQRLNVMRSSKVDITSRQTC